MEFAGELVYLSIWSVAKIGSLQGTAKLYETLSQDIPFRSFCGCLIKEERLRRNYFISSSLKQLWQISGLLLLTCNRFFVGG